MKTNLFTLVLLFSTLSVVAQTPYLYYNFENDLNDKVGTNNGVHSIKGDGSSSATFSAGKVGQCYEINATAALGNNYVKTPIGVLNPAQTDLEFTILGWFQIGNDAETYNGNIGFCVINPGVNPADGVTAGQQRNMILAFLKTGYQYFSTYIINANVPAVPNPAAGTEPTLFTPNTWHHLAVTSKKNETDATKRDLRMYYDGVEVGNSLSQTLFNSYGEITLGYKEVTSGTPLIYIGKIDEFAIYKTALDATQITNVFANGISTGISDNKMDEILNVTSKNNQISITLSVNGSKSVSVNDLSGKLIFAKKFDANSITTPVLSKGIYIVTAEANGYKTHKKVTVY